MALDTLFFDLKLNDLTDEQMKTIKSRLEKQLGLNLDLGKQIEQSVNKGGGVKVKVGANTEAAEAAIRRMTELLEKGNLSKTEINELNAITKALKSVSSAAEKTKKDVQKVAEETSNVHTIKIDNRDSNVINLLKNNLEVAWQKAIALENELKGIYNSGKNINGDSSLRNYVKRISEELYNARNSVVGLESALSSMSKMNGSVVINDKMSDFGTKKQAAELEQRKRVWKQWAEEQDKADRAASESARKQALAQAELAREQAKAVRQSELENSAMIKLRATIESMELAMRRYEAVSNAMGKPKSIEAAIQKLREYIELARQASKSPTSTSEFLKSNSLGAGANAKDNVSSEIALARELQRQERAAQAASAAQERLANSQQRAAQATNSHANASVRLGNSLTGLVSITGDLRNQIGMLISAYTVEHLLKNVVEIGGEFEKQKLAMGSMLGSLEQADDIFNRMKNLALTSPFNFKDLSNYSRQLTAFGTPYKDLYDTTNRLADISAGLGGDMSRLVLAFSQVKAAAYLRGQEMRQFTEFGVSLPDLLAKKYSEAEHRIVTAGDVIERVSKRMVSFNDVKDVLWKSTDKGGQFYGMQNVLAQSTSGMASNLKDAIDTMYYDIAKSNSGMIKGTIKNITELVSHWRELTSVLSAGTIVYGAYRLIIAAHNRMIGMNTAETLKGVMAAKQEEASLLRRKALNEGLTEEEQRRLATSKKITASDVQSMAANKMINSDQLMRLVNSGRISPEMAASSAKMVGLNKVGRDYLATLIRLDRGISQNALSWRMFTSVFSNAADMNTLKINLLSRAQKAWLTGTRLLGDALSSLGSMFATILSPANIGMAGISLALSSIIDYNQRISQLKDANKQMIKDAEDSSKSIGKFLDENSIADISKKGASDIDNMVEEYRKQLEESPLDMSHFLANVDTIDNATEKLTAMREELEKIKKVDDDVSKNGNPFMASAQSMEHLLPDWMIGLEDKIVPIINLAKDKTLNGLFNDLESGAAKVNRAMADVTSSQLTEAIKNIKKESPDAAKELDALASSGANADEIVRRLIETGHSDAIVGIFGNLSVSDIGNYSRSLDNVKSKINDVIDGLGSKFKGINTGTATEEEVMEFKKLADGIAKSMNLSGDSLDLWNSKIEEMTSHSDKNLKYETYSWKVFTDNIKSIAEKKGIDLNKASQRQWLELVIDAKRQCGVLYPWMSNFLQSLISMANNNPIQFVIGIKSQVTGRQPLKGRGKQLAGNFAVSSLLGYDKLSTIQTDKDASDLVKSTYETYQEDMKNAKANRKSTKDIQAKWNQFKEIMSSEMNVDFIIGGEKIGGKRGHVGTGGGTKTDTFLKDMQDKLDQVKKAMDVYKKWKDTGISESESIDKMDASGIFSKGTFKNIVSENGLNDWYKKTLENLSNMVKKAKSTPERKKYTESIAELFGEFDRDETKKKLEETSKQIEDMMSETAKKWDSYKQLLESGMSKEIASSFIFGGNTQYSSKSEALADSFYNQMSEKGRYRNIGFDITEDEAKKILGDDAIGKALLSAWKMAKDEIEKERIQIQFDGQKAISQVQGIADKIKTTLSTALDKAIRKNSTNGKETKLGDYAETGDNGLLKLKDGAEKILTDRELEMVNSYIEVTNQEITKLGSSLLELLPAWDDIFGKSAYMSLEQLLRGMREAKEIVENAKIVNDKNGKPSYFTSTYKDKDGNTQSVSGNIGELDRLRNQEDTRQGDINKKNPFVGMFDSARNYFSAKKEENRWSNIAKQAEKNGGFAEYTDENGNKQKISTDDAKSKEKDSHEQATHAALSFSDAMKGAIDEMQKWNNALSLLGSTIEAVGGGTGASDAAGVAGGMLSGAASLSSFGPYGMAAGAAMGAITSIAQLHDKKLDRAIEKSKERVQELNLAYKSIEDSLKYNLGNAAGGSLVNNSEIQKVKDAQANVASMKSKGKLSIFDLMSLQKSEKILKESAATIKYLDENDKDNYGNAYNYQRNLYKEQLAELEKQKQAEEDKKKTDQSKVNDYNSQIEEMETKITQFSEDLASSLYGIDIKGWASQFGDALFEAWQKGESGAEAFNKTAASILQSLVKSWFKTNVIENAFKNLQKDLFGENGQGGIFGTNNDLTQEDISKIASDIMSAQGDITSKMKKLDELYAVLEKKGIDIKGNSSSSTTNAISGVSEQEANIIAAYMDAIRQDTYNNRMNLLKIVENGVKIESSPMMQAQLLQLQQIQSNTYRNMELVGDIKSMFNDVILGNKKIYVN